MDKQIDKLIYELYRLTDEEIAIVESSSTEVRGSLDMTPAPIT